VQKNEEFLYDVNKGRAYYGKSIGREQQEEVWTDRPYRSGYRESDPPSSRLFHIGVGVGAYALFRKYPDIATGLTRALEDHALPFKWGRTFGLSNFMSNQETVVREAFKAGHVVSGTQVDTQLGKYLSALVEGRATPEQFQELGYTLKDDKLFLGQAGQAGSREVLGHAEVMRVAEGSSNAAGTAWTKANLSPNIEAKFNFLKQEVTTAAGTIEIERAGMGGMPYQIVGAETKARAAAARAKAIGAEFFVYRFNRLLSEEFQSNPLTEKLAKNLKNLAPNFFRHGLGVQVGTPVQTYKALAGKLGLMVGVAPLAYAQADWAAEQVFGFGPTKAIATTYVGARLGWAHAMDAAGIPGVGDMYDLQDWFEKTMPGSTSPWNLAGFGVMGWSLGATAIGLIERGEVARHAALYGNTGEGFSERFRKAGEVVHQQFLNFNAEGDPERPLSKLSKWLLKQGRLLGTAQPAMGDQEAAWYHQPHRHRASLWKKIMSMGVATTRAPTPAGTMPLNLRFPFTPVPIGRATMMKVGGAIGAIAGFLFGGPATIASAVGLFVPDERPEELEAIYSGRKEVPVTKGRFWEFGRTSFEGDEIEYYRPHWYARMMSGAHDKSLWGEDENYSPLRKLLLGEFTNYLEEKHYYDRPYPITALPFADVPLVGPILSNTIGRIIKPPQLMHQEEWEDDGWFKVSPPGRGETYATELGETPGGVPESPYSFGRTFGRQWNLLSQGAGLLGYAQRTAVEGVTGTPGIGDQTLVLESFNNVTSRSRNFYDLQLGGMAGLNEGFRRLYPTEEKSVRQYNPIRNTMPNWMPGAGSQSIDFQHGDPYAKVPEGEYRLPGAGYAARFEELRGLDPEDYPLIHKFKILADIAPHSDEFRGLAEQVKSASKNNTLDEMEESIYQSTLEQLENKRTRKKFVEYKNHISTQNKYGSNKSKGVLSLLNKNTADKDDQFMLTKIMGAWGEFALHFQSPLEYIYPLSPESKFNPIRTAVEGYERDILYGTTNAFWNKPIRDFILPTGRTALNKLGYQGIFSGTKDVRQLEEYFDVLKYIKNVRLANMAALNDDQEAKVIFDRRKKQTLFGMNPYTSNETSILKALPRRDRDYYQAFVDTSSPEERERILEMVPSNQRNLYLARWKLKYVEDIQEARDQELIMGSAIDRVSDEINAINMEARSEGFPSSPELYKAFMDSKYPGESYGDWYRRTQTLGDLPLPGSDWIGWHPSVDLEDIKLKTVMELGEDMHDYNLWPSRLDSLAGKPFINDEAIRPILNPERMDMRGRLNELFAINQMHAQIEMKKNWGYEDRQSITVELEQ